MARGNVSCNWNEDSGQEGIAFTFADGQTLEFAYHSLPEASKIALGLHGLTQRTRDSIAGDQKKGATIADLIATMRSVYEPLTTGEWSAKRGDSDGPAPTLAIEALARMLAAKFGGEPDLAVAKQRWESLPKEQRTAAVKAPEFAAVIAQIRAEKAAARAAKAQAEPAAASQDGMFGLLG